MYRRHPLENLRRHLPLKVAVVTLPGGPAPLGLLQRRTRTTTALRVAHHLPITMHLPDATCLTAGTPVTPVTNATITWRSGLVIFMFVVLPHNPLLDRLVVIVCNVAEQCRLVVLRNCCSRCHCCIPWTATCTAAVARTSGENARDKQRGSCSINYTLQVS